VGWSYGAFTAMYWADRHPGRVLGVVNVDGALPAGLTGEAGRERIRKLFRRARLLLPLVAPFGLAARMSADQHAEVNIELNEIAATCAPVLERVTRPARYVLATGDSYGSKDGEQDGARAALEPVLVRNPNLQVSAKVASNHGAILRKDYRAIAQAIREITSAGDRMTDRTAG
jgi:pimeloyl-ACP methyl ester carboxylesterase